MKIEDLIAGKNDSEKLNLEGIPIPVAALKNYMKDGYEHIRPYKEEKTVSLWGKACTGCFTEEEIRNKAQVK